MAAVVSRTAWPPCSAAILVCSLAVATWWALAATCSTRLPSARRWAGRLDLGAWSVAPRAMPSMTWLSWATAAFVACAERLLSWAPGSHVLDGHRDLLDSRAGLGGPAAELRRRLGQAWDTACATNLLAWRGKTPLRKAH